jgi:hypothetical protein
MAGDTKATNQMNQALVERLLDDLGKLMWAMTWDIANHDRWMLDPEEVHAELCLELVKLVDRYGHRPYIELKRVCVTSMRNRVHDLATACYLTNRKAEANMISIESSQEDDQRCTDASLEFVQTRPTGRYGDMYATSDDITFDMDDFCESMSGDARCLVEEVLNPTDRTAYFLWLTAQRKQTVSPKGFWTLTITPAIMARSLGWSIDRLQTAWAEVSDIVSGQAHFNGGLVAKENGR